MSNPTIPNSHTRMFTRIPSSVSKRWTTRCVSLVDRQELDKESHHHESSLISSIKIEVKFNPMLQFSSNIIHDDDDIASNLIDGWQEARKEWAELEESIENSIKQFTDRHLTRAKDHSIKSMDVLSRKRTSYDCTEPKLDGKSLHKPSLHEPTSNAPQSAASTIHPSDSVSSVSKFRTRYDDSSIIASTARRTIPKMAYATGWRKR